MKQVPLAMALAAALAYVVAGPGAPDQDAMRLQQEINTLKYKLDYETDRLELFDGGATQRVFLGLEADAVLELRDAAGEVSVRLPGPGQ